MMAKLLGCGFLVAALGSVLNAEFLLPLGFLIAMPAIVWLAIGGGRN